MKGKVYLIGAGPGKHDLITVRGARILEQADVVIYDYLVDKQLFIYIRDDAECICAGKIARKGKYSYGHPIAQGLIDNIIIEKVKAQKKVVRLKNGDPAFFSRFSEELRALTEAGIEYEVVPGVTAASAASSFTCIPLTDRDHASSCAFTTGHENPQKASTINDWNILSKSGTLIIYMGVGNLKKITGKIIETGKSPDTPVVVIKDISLTTQSTITGNLRNIAGLVEKESVTPPALIVVGSVVEMGDDLNWLKRNRTILFTGLSEERFFLEGNYRYIPLIKIEALNNYDQFDSYVMQIHHFDWLVFTSRYGVEHFFRRLHTLGMDARAFHHTRIAVVGQSTSNELHKHGLREDLMPEEELSHALFEKLKAEGIRGKSILAPCSDISDKGIKKALESADAIVTTAVAYNNVIPKGLPELNFDEVDEIVFTSPSTVKNFKRRYGAIPKRIEVRCIGNVTRTEFEKRFQGDT